MFGLIQKLFFSHIGALIALGKKRPLEASDIESFADVVERDEAQAIFAGVEPIWCKDGEKPRRTQVIRFLFQIMTPLRQQVFVMYALAFGMLGCELAGPVVLNRLLTLLESTSKNSAFIFTGVGWALAYGLLGLSCGLFGQHYIYRFLLIGRTVARGINERIYSTTLGLSRSAKQKYPVGDVVNYMGSDTDSLQDFVWSLCELLIAATSIVMASLMMVHYLGAAGIYATIALVILIPLTKILAKRYLKFGDEIAKARDQRMGYLTQTLTSIRVVKSFGWESLVADKVGRFRAQEINNRRKFVQTSALSVLMYQLIGTLVGAIVFAMMVYFGEEITAAKLFTSMALIGLMEGPFDRFPQIISMLSQAMVSGERIGKYLAADTLPKAGESASSKRSVGVTLSKLTLKFSDATASVIKDFNLNIDPGKAIAIVGPVGGGKSSLLGGILGNVPIRDGGIRFFDEEGIEVSRSQVQFSYVPQEAFILNSSLRENIEFGEEKPELSVPLWASCLDKDLDHWPAGLDTEIGEHGVNLSGGQKQRVAMARAVAKDPGIALLDDPLSALDEETESKLLERLIFGLWSNKTRVVVTHRLRHLARFDLIVFIENGEAVATGTLDQLLQSSKRFTKFYQDHALEQTNKERLQEPVSDLEKPYSSSDAEIIRQSHADVAEVSRITENEDRQYGVVGVRHYGSYIRAMVSPRTTPHQSATPRRSSLTVRLVMLAVIMILATLGPIVVNSWIGAWGEVLDHANRGVANVADASLGQYSPITILSRFVSFNHSTNIAIYVLIAIVSSLVVWLQYYVYGTCGVQAGQNFHDHMLRSILGAKLRFFDATPIGRILNRFAKDLELIEQHLPWRFESTVRTFLSMISQLLLISLLLPITIVVTLPMLVAYYQLQKGYRSSSREAQRLSSAARSPRFSHFKETIQGLDVIRAFGRQDAFKDEFHRRITLSQQMFLGVVLLNRWFSLRVAVAASVLSLAIGMSCVIAASKGWIYAGTAGLALVYGLRFWEALNWSVRTFVELESGMTSVERVVRFVEIPQESSLNQASAPLGLIYNAITAPASRTSGARVEFKNVKMRYASHLPLILKGLSFTIDQGQRVGIVGRTGAGKSSLFHALYRFSELEEGDILIDGRSVTEMSLTELRRSFATVPQDPVLFLGRLRENIDPFGQFTDSEIWTALARVHLRDRIRYLGDESGTNSGLDLVISENGSNLSQGERQLICLARAVLTNAQVILMDEATSAIDVETDARIQLTIRQAFAGRTIIMIAHRWETIADCDQIIEISDGSVYQVTKPSRPKSVQPNYCGQDVNVPPVIA